MPIAASLSSLQGALLSALSSGSAAQTSRFASQLASAVASAASTGLKPTSNGPIPLVPSGASAGRSIFSAALSMKQGAQVSSVARQLAQGISVIAPLCPPAGLGGLSSSIKSALSARQAAKQSVVAKQIAVAVVAYYTSGGII